MRRQMQMKGSISLILFILIFCGSWGYSAIKPVNLKVEYQENPISIESPAPRLSWGLESSERNKLQSGYHILVASSQVLLLADTGDLWDTGWVVSRQSIHVPYQGTPLVSGQQVFWKVRVADEQGIPSNWSGSGTWEMGLLNESDWSSEWISADLDAPLLRLPFTVTEQPYRARVYICGLGLHELRLNGLKVGDHVLDPVFTHYDHRCLVVVHDVTAQIQNGDNVIGVMLGNGWFNLPTEAEFGFSQAPWRQSPRMRLELHLYMPDGSIQRVLSNGDWKVTAGPITYNSMRGGESYDARLEHKGWDDLGFDDQTWTSAQVVEAPQGKLSAQNIAPIKVVESVLPVDLHQPQPGVYIFDFGRNMAGWVTLRVDGSAGSTVTLKYGERLLDTGLIDQEDIGSLILDGRVQTDTYTLKGGGSETWEPRFTYHGFRYVQVEGLPQLPRESTLVARVVRTDFKKIMNFSSSNPLINQIYQAACASYESNFVGIPTDNPHREKMGWTGDALFAQELGIYNYFNATGYTHWLEELRDSQQESGLLPPIVPTAGWGYDWGLLPVWNSAAILMPWNIYRFYGDVRVLQENYNLMKGYLFFINNFADGNDLIYQGLGDWNGPEPKTPAVEISSLYFYRMAKTVAQIANLLGIPEDVQFYDEMANRIRDTYNQTYLNDETNQYNLEKQTPLSCVVHSGVAEGEAATEAIHRLANGLHNSNYQLDIGVVGAQSLFDVLVDAGYGDAAYAAATQTQEPSWGYWISQGATTLWEEWDGEHSRNHVYFGDIAAWFIRGLVGLTPDDSHPGFSHFTITPGTFGDLTWIDANMETLRGPIGIQWNREEWELTVNVSAPPNTSATLRLPAGPYDTITESGVDPSSAEGVTYVGRKGNTEVFTLGSGTYSFKVSKSVIDGITNGGFEEPLRNSSNPPYWLVGFHSSKGDYPLRGNWALDNGNYSEGATSLRLEPRSKLGYKLTQVLHAPTHDLKGKLVRIRVDIKHKGLIEPPLVQLLALNKSLPPDPQLGTGLAGGVTLIADPQTTGFKTYAGEFRATEDAQCLVVILSTKGKRGAVWFDDLIVELEAPPPQPVPSTVANLHNFSRGFSGDQPMDLSERALEEMIERFATCNDVINLFSHVGWVMLTGERLEHVHRNILRQAELARQHGLKVLLSFDFTHDLPETVGYLNTLPDRTPVGSLHDPSVFRALELELFALYDLIQPEYVMVGIEMDIMQHRLPDEWPAYVVLFKEVAAELVARNPEVHVSTYFTLPWMVNPEYGYIEHPRDEMWRQLLPELSSIAFSIYPGLVEMIFDLPTYQLLPGYFIKAGEIAPELPILIPEFGVPGGGDALYSEERQAEILSTILAELDTANVEMVSWYSAYNNRLFDEVPWFSIAFQTVGIHYQSGEPKLVWYTWRGE